MNATTENPTTTTTAATVPLDGTTGPTAGPATASGPVDPASASGPVATTGAAASGTAAPGAPLSISSLVLGLASIVTGSLLIVPIVGLVLGLLARTREPQARTTWLVGLWLNAVVLAVSALVVLVVGAGALFLGLSPLLAELAS